MGKPRTKVEKAFLELSKIINSEFSDYEIETGITEDNCFRLRMGEKIIEIDKNLNLTKFQEEYPDLSDEDKDAIMEECMEKIESLRKFFLVFKPENDMHEYYSRFFQHFSEIETEVQILKDVGIISELDLNNENTEFSTQTFHSSTKSKSRSDN